MTRSTWAVGDVHGCATELRQLLGELQSEGPCDVVLVGDLYTKGPDPAGVWRLIRDERLRAVRGNHDERLLRFLRDKDPDDSHAAKVVEALDAEDPAWRKHLKALPLVLEVADWTIVHASVHPSGKLKRTSKRDLIARRRHPKDRSPHPFWWSVYAGQRRVAFGHDAARGLVQVHRHGQLVLAGLDTGCVYGGRLTALRLHDGALRQVHAARPYRPIRSQSRSRAATVTPRREV